MRNLALGKPALQSSVSPYSVGRTPAEDAKGGNNGRISGLYGFHTEAEVNPWWQVDLEDWFVVREVVIYNRAENVLVAGRLKRFTVLGSDDGKKWKELFRKTDDEVFYHEPFRAAIAGAPPTRFVRVRLDGGRAPLHFRECQVFGVHPNPATRARMQKEDEKAVRRRYYRPRGRQGRVIDIDGLAVFVDENYGSTVITMLERDGYERKERFLVSQLVTQADRVIEVGTAIGVVTMTAARITGADSVMTFEANPAIAKDAQANFRRNGLDGICARVGILKNRRAITDREKTATFYIDRVFLGSRLNASASDAGIIKKVQTPIFCLEDAIEEHRATVLICDIEGGEVELLNGADLSGIRLIIMEAHYWAAGEVAIDEMVRQLIMNGFFIHLDLSQTRVLALRRHS